MGLHADDPAGAGQAERHGGHRLPRAGGRRRLLPREGRPLPRRHVRGAAGGLPLRRDPRRRVAAAAATPASAPASGARPARTARTPAASSGCTGSTRSRCSCSRRSRSRTPSTSASSAWERAWLDALELPYRVIDVAAGDLGLSAVRKFDCEAWIPSQGKLPRGVVGVQLHRSSRLAASTSARVQRWAAPRRWPRSTARSAP